MKRRQNLVSTTAVLALAACTLFPGCGGEDWHAETYPAHGRVTINGEPAAGAVVELHATGEKPDVRNSRPWAVVEDDGAYTLSTYEKGDGAPPGDYALTVRWPPDVSQPSLADRLGGAYATPAQSQWSVTISEGDNQLPPVEITGAKVLPQEQTGAAAQRPSGPPMGK
jgi:hypothetical protein